MTDAGGMGVLIADAVDAYSLRLVDFSPSTVSKFRATFPPYYQCANPMDLTGSAKTEDMLKAGKLALEDPNIDAVIMGVQPIAPGFADPDKLAEILVDHFGPGKTKKPFLVVEFGGKHNDDRMMRTIMKEKGMAVYPGAEEALRCWIHRIPRRTQEDHHAGRIPAELRPRPSLRWISPRLRVCLTRSWRRDARR